MVPFPNDLERTLTLFSRSHHSLTLNISNGYRYGYSYYSYYDNNDDDDDVEGE